jgi:DNA replication and repair protein RecF
MRYASRLAEVDLDLGPEATEAERGAALLTALRAHRARDEQRGVTGVGPHRDDLEVRLDGAMASTFASQGQARALVLAFKIAELASARAHLGHAPLLLLDDVSSELDPGRNAQLFETLAAEAGQCLLTTTATHFISLPEGVERVDVGVREGRFENTPRD